jgi:1-acyl-sn-glycerol-3-phosphate acyltransferase
MFSLLDPLLDFYYRYWFRVEQQGVEHVPSEGGALLVSNHSGALPPDGR